MAAPPSPAPAAEQLVLPLVPPPVSDHPPPPALVLAPLQLWSSLPPPLQTQIRQTLLLLLQEVVPHVDG